MHPEALAFVASQRVCVFAVEMMDGSPHAATVHFAHHGDAPTFIVLTERRYRKAEPLFGRPASRATVVLGFAEGKMQTLQIDGNAERLTDADNALREAYFSKFPDKRAKCNEPDDFFFKFTPTWWRFTDWSKPVGKTVYLSDGSVTVAK